VVKAPATEVSSGTVRYVPPEQRFYAGGANDVRGYDRNELGPVVYVVLDTAAVPDDDGQYPSGAVQVSPIGGNYSLVLNAELRVPSPVFSNRMRFGLFVDGGTVWQEGGPVDLAAQFRITPGAGARFATPLGPARIDVAYNGYNYPAGPLYESQADGTLVVLQESYVKPRSPGLTFHFAIGHAF
jgi:outer membrane protein assembly factor BamA